MCSGWINPWCMRCIQNVCAGTEAFLFCFLYTMRSVGTLSLALYFVIYGYTCCFIFGAQL